MRTVLIVLALAGCTVDKSTLLKDAASDAGFTVGDAKDRDADTHVGPGKDAAYDDAGPADSASDSAAIEDSSSADAEVDAAMADATTALPEALAVQCQPCLGGSDDCGDTAECSSQDGQPGVCRVRCSDFSLCNGELLLTCMGGLCFPNAHVNYTCADWRAAQGI